MEKITKDISEIIAGEIRTINDKVRGLNFLELLKAGIIEKLLELVNRQKFPLDQIRRECGGGWHDTTLLDRASYCD